MQGDVQNDMWGDMRGDMCADIVEPTLDPYSSWFQSLDLMENKEPSWFIPVVAPDTSDDFGEADPPHVEQPW